MAPRHAYARCVRLCPVPRACGHASAMHGHKGDGGRSCKERARAWLRGREPRRRDHGTARHAYAAVWPVAVPRACTRPLSVTVADRTKTEHARGGAGREPRRRDRGTACHAHAAWPVAVPCASSMWPWIALHGHRRDCGRSYKKRARMRCVAGRDYGGVRMTPQAMRMPPWLLAGVVSSMARAGRHQYIAMCVHAATSCVPLTRGAGRRPASSLGVCPWSVSVRLPGCALGAHARNQPSPGG